MTRALVFAAIAVAALAGVNCSPAGGDIFPLSVGSVWNMDVVLMAGTAAAALDTMQTGTAVSTAVDKANLATGPEVIKFRNDVTVHILMPDTTYTMTTYAYYREDGDWILSYADLDDSIGDTVMVTSPSVGKTWHQGTSTVEVIGQEDVSVPAGTFKNAWKVKLTTNTAMEMFYWFAGGTGMVKLHYEFTDMGYTQVYDQSLTSATIK